MSVNLSIRDLLVAVERRNGVTMRNHVTLDDLARSLLYRWPEDDRGDEWIIAQTMCLEAMEGVRDPEQARAAFVAAAQAAGMLMVREEYIQERPEPRPRKTKRGHSPSTH
jgi:hypothetical protein